MTAARQKHSPHQEHGPVDHEEQAQVLGFHRKLISASAALAVDVSPLKFRKRSPSCRGKADHVQHDATHLERQIG